MMKHSLRWMVVGVLGLACVGCGTSPIQATVMTPGTSAWVEDPSFGLYYCTATEGEKGPKPICVVPKRYDETHPPAAAVEVKATPAPASIAPSHPSAHPKETH